MPKVKTADGKTHHFPYTKTGTAAAHRFAKESGGEYKSAKRTAMKRKYAKA